MFDWFSGSGGGLTGTDTWSNLQNVASNYQYDPANPSAWSDLQNQMGDYMKSTGGVGPNTGGSWIDRNITPALEKLPEALKGLGKSQADAAKAQADSAQKMQQIQAAASHQGQPGSLNELVGLLLKRQEALQGGVQSGQPVPAGNRLGLLGF